MDIDKVVPAITDEMTRIFWSKRSLLKVLALVYNGNHPLAPAKLNADGSAHKKNIIFKARSGRKFIILASSKLSRDGKQINIKGFQKLSKQNFDKLDYNDVVIYLNGGTGVFYGFTHAECYDFQHRLRWYPKDNRLLFECPNEGSGLVVKGDGTKELVTCNKYKLPFSGIKNES